MIQHVRTVFSFKNKKNVPFLIKKTINETENEKRDVRASWAQFGVVESQEAIGPQGQLQREGPEEEEEGAAWAGRSPTETRV
jgi:hypothetical protein